MTEILPNWNLKDFYDSIDDNLIQSDLNQFEKFAKNFQQKYKSKLLDHSNFFERVIEEYEQGSELGDKLGNYAFLIYATNMNETKIVQFYQDINEKLTELSSDLIFFTNEINSTKENDFLLLLDGSGKYKNWLINLRRYKDHQLDEKSEKLLLDKNLTANSAWVRFFEEQINDLKFNIEGKDLNSSDALNLLSDHESETRKKAAISIESVFQKNVKTFTFITNTLAKDKITNDKWRGYNSPISARNLANNVEDEVIDALTESVTSNYKNIAHRYYALKSKIFNKDKLNYWDRNAPYPNSPNTKIKWQEAKDLVLKSYENFDSSFKDIILLKVLGVKQLDIALLFFLNSFIISIFSIILGTILGIILSTNIDSVEKILSGLLNFDLWNNEIRYLSTMPYRIKTADITFIISISLLATLISSYIPILRIFKIKPNLILR